MKKGFWTVLEECIGQRIEGDDKAKPFSLDMIESYFKSHKEWGRPLPGFWLDMLLDERLRPTDFKWKVERQGNDLRFTPIP